MIHPNDDQSGTDSVVVSFRAPRALVQQLDEMASGDQRTRANFIVRTLTHAVTLEPAISTIERILPWLCELDQKRPDSIQAEFQRGAMSGARAMLGAFFGKRAIRWVNSQVRQRTKLPMPHVVPAAEDGNRYGFDSEADI
jgi:predicted transcriptional regulator